MGFLERRGRPDPRHELIHLFTRHAGNCWCCEHLIPCVQCAGPCLMRHDATLQMLYGPYAAHMHNHTATAVLTVERR